MPGTHRRNSKIGRPHKVYLRRKTADDGSVHTWYSSKPAPRKKVGIPHQTYRRRKVARDGSVLTWYSSSPPPRRDKSGRKRRRK